MFRTARRRPSLFPPAERSAIAFLRPEIGAVVGIPLFGEAAGAAAEPPEGGAYPSAAFSPAIESMNSASATSRSETPPASCVERVTSTRS